ncbi:SDR family NAD(P)-dependent oxidoreductase, partial [Streptomyces sp. NPDC001139]
MLLTDKTAIIYGAGGSIGGAVARAFAAEGARLHLVGRTRATLEAVAADLKDAEVAVVDALDEAAVEVWFPDDPRQVPWDRFLDEVAEAGYAWIELGP